MYNSRNNNKFTTHNCQIEVVTPLHIGYGDYGNYSSENYILDGKKIYVLKDKYRSEILELYNKANSLDGKNPSEIKAETSLVKVLVENKNKDLKKEKITNALDFFGEEKENMNINGFAKSLAINNDGEYENMLFVAGSSIKGAIKKALLYKTRKSKLSIDIFSSKSLFNEFRVEDSDPIPYSNLGIYEKIYLISEVGEIESKQTMYLEMLKPNTIINFNISVSEKFLNVLKDKKIIETNTLESLFKSLKTYIEEVKEVFNKYNSEDFINYQEFTKKNPSYNLFLGGQNGILTKQQFHGIEYSFKVANGKVNNLLPKKHQTEGERVAPKCFKMVHLDNKRQDLDNETKHLAPIGLVKIGVTK